MSRHAFFRPGFGIVLNPVVPFFYRRKIDQGAILAARSVIALGRFLASIRQESPLGSQSFDQTNFRVVGHITASLSGCSNSPRLPFDRLRANGTHLEFVYP